MTNKQTEDEMSDYSVFFESDSNPNDSVEMATLAAIDCNGTRWVNPKFHHTLGMPEANDYGAMAAETIRAWEAAGRPAGTPIPVPPPSVPPLRVLIDAVLEYHAARSLDSAEDRSAVASALFAAIEKYEAEREIRSEQPGTSRYGTGTRTTRYAGTDALRGVPATSYRSTDEGSRTGAE